MLGIPGGMGQDGVRFHYIAQNGVPLNNDHQPFWLRGLVSWKKIFPWTWDGGIIH